MASDAERLFAKYFNLTPLQGRRTGKVRCIFQPSDRHPSMSLDLNRGFFHCFSCGVGGGLRRFRELVADANDPQPSFRRRSNHYEDAHREVLRRERWRQETRARYAIHNEIASALFAGYQAMMSIRRATMEDNAKAWECLVIAAELERELYQLEDDADAELAAVSTEGRRR